MAPIELYVLSVYKFKLFQRLFTSITEFLGAIIFTKMFIFCKYIGVKHACSWRLIRESTEKWFPVILRTEVH